VSIFETVKTAGQPPIRDIFLSNASAPRLGYNNAEDQPWAWQSREFLRELVIGKKVKFHVEHRTANGREYGSVQTDTGVNLGEAIAAAGWVEVRPPPDGKEPRTDEHKAMIESFANAKEQKIGMFQEDQTDAETPKPQEKLSAIKLFDRYKDKPTQATVEYIRDAGCYNVVLKDSRQKITLKVAGVNVPRVPSKARQEEGEKPEPFALEARFFAERHLLHRDVEVLITAPGEANRSGEFYGSIQMAGHSLAGQLIRNGYGKLVEWNAPPQELDNLKALQKEAAAKKLRLWKYASPEESSTERTEWAGRVKEIRDGSSVVIEDVTSGESKFVLLSNVKVPRLLRNEPQPYAYQARELLRKQALGNKVTVVVDYVRNERDYCTVFMGKTNLASMLVEAGLANVVSYDENEKSTVYQELTIAENRARAAGKNIWNKNAVPPVYRVTDLTLRSNDTEKKESKAKAKQFVGALQRAGRVQGIVEHVFNGSRLKISIPNENCIIAFGLEALRTPSDRTSDSDKEKELSKEVFNFVYDKLYQRDVDLIVESADQNGNFFGSLFLGGNNFGVTLLEMGYAKTNGSTVEYTNYAVEYQAAEESAKQKGIRIWSIQREVQPDASEEENKQVRLYSVTVSEVLDGNWFFLQMNDNQTTLKKIMSDLSAEDHSVAPGLDVKRGGLYTAKMPDNQWYRVRADKVDKNRVSVVCIDYGTGATIDRADVRPLSSKLASAPALAKECSLAFLQIPSVGEDYGEEAADVFYNLVWDKQLYASVEYTENNRSFVCLGDGNELVNVQMVESGMAVTPVRKTDDPRKANLLQRLRAKEADARRAHLGRWEYGDFRDEETY